MKTKLLVFITMLCFASVGYAELYIWGGAGSEAAVVSWNDTTDGGNGVNADADHWGNPVQPNTYGGDSVMISSGGVSRNTNRVTGESFIELLGGYLRTNGSDAGRNADNSPGQGGRITIDGGYANCQWIAAYPTAVFEIISGRVNVRGGGEPVPDQGAFIDFTGNSGTLTAPNKNQAYFEGKITGGIIRIDGVQLSAVDEVVNDKYFSLNGTTLALVSPKALEPTPRIRAFDVPVDQVLSWTTGRDPADTSQANPAVTKHFVYVSNGDPADPNLYLKDTVPVGQAAEFVPGGGLKRDGVYYWRIDEGIADYPASDSNNITGDIWYFTTVPSTPVIDESTPVRALVDDEGEATLTVSAINPITGDPNGLSYEWYKVGTPDVKVGTDSATLIISPAGLGDEGLYYCKVTVTANGASLLSPQAPLVIKRMIGHWPFNGTLDDAVGINNGTAAAVQYAPGIVDADQAVLFGAASEAVEIPTTGHINLDWTLSWWEKSNPDAAAGEWETMVGSGATSGFEALECDRFRTTSYRVGVAGSYTGANAVGAYDRGQWHHQVVTYDSVSGAVSVYVNGRLDATTTASGFEGFDVSLFVGNVRDGSQPYMGVIDDLQFYNYPLDAAGIAGVYLLVRPGESWCSADIEWDLDGDCDVDFADLSMFLDELLECGLYPDCIN